MSGRILGLDSTQASIAAKSCAAIIVGYAVSLAFEWKASSVAVTIIVLQTTAVGSTLNKAAMRLAGTFSGAALGLIWVALAAYDRELFILGMALLTAYCVWAMQASSRVYAWQLVVLTAAYVGWPAASDPLNVFPTSVDRLTAVSMGVILSSLVHGVFWPITAGGRFERTMRELISGCRDLLSLLRQGIPAGKLDNNAVVGQEAKIASLTASLGSTLQAARADSKRIRRHFARYEQLTDDLQHLTLAIATVDDAASLLNLDSSTSASPSQSLVTAFDSADHCLADTVSQLSQPRDGSCLLDADYRPIDTDEITSSESLLIGRIDSLSRVATRVRSRLTVLEAPEASTPSEAMPRGKELATGPRLKKSVLALFQVLASAWFFSILNWPLGFESSMMLVMIIVFLNAQLPVALVARTFVQGVGCALPLAAFFYFLVMPGVDGFAELAPWLMVLFFPLMYAVAGSNPLKSMAAMLTVLLTNSLISVSSTPPGFDFGSFMSIYVGMSGGFGVALFLAYVFETRSPRRGFPKVLAGLLLQAADFLKELNDPTHTQAQRAELTTTRRKQAISTLAKAKKLSATVDYGQDPCIAKSQIQSLLQTFDALVIRLAGAGPLVATGELNSENAQKATHWCIATLTATGKALGRLQPLAPGQPNDAVMGGEDGIPTQPGGAGEYSPDAISAESTTSTYHRTLISAILDCRNKLESINWKRWCQNYF